MIRRLMKIMIYKFVIYNYKSQMNVYIVTKDDTTTVYENLDDAKKIVDNESDIKTAVFVKTQLQSSKSVSENHILIFVLIVIENYLLRNYEFVQENSNCHQLMIRLQELLNTKYIQDTTLIGDSIIFKFYTMAYDLLDYLESQQYELGVAKNIE